ncbi:hypothetical protein A7985_24235 [Pseudoalteromonas luteoviolacea]|uniref:Uncharacterized protein n=1 Tax=Pseudoalteromonas luteoviolacea TaxID=43657 RepID=A0A1C0TJP8_9GAMM|nr:hypothetical protein [Pseudoalteromonas luteoviolacea]OCQ18321.1 hypothetical protein A7985_24235 [Pseudoalteromonas luteoviolacea]
MKKLANILFALTILAPFHAFAQVVQCGDAYVDSIAIETNRADMPILSRTLLISFKDAKGATYVCGDTVYGFVSTADYPVEFNAVMSLAFMAKANNLPVRVFINTSNIKVQHSARELSALQIQSDVPGFHDVK